MSLEKKKMMAAHVCLDPHYLVADTCLALWCVVHLCNQKKFVADTCLP